MTNFNFADGLRENVFAYSNDYYYGDRIGTELYFSKEGNYPYILTSTHADDVELQFCISNYQLRNRTLNVKKLKEIMDTCPLPIRVAVQGKEYLIGKGFLAEYSAGEAKIGKLLFVACAKPGTTDMGKVKFFIARRLYHEDHKAFHGIIKGILTVHTGDVTICNDLLDYMSERISIPEGGNISSRKRYTELLVRASIEETFRKMREESPRGPIVTTTTSETIDISSDDYSAF